MEYIKFSHEYWKMPFPVRFMDKTVLLDVFVVDKSELSPEFIEYDTRIETHSSERKYSQLSSGKLLVLLLHTTHNIDFVYQTTALLTTIRRHTPEKEAYYRRLRGQQVQIVIEGD